MALGRPDMALLFAEAAEGKAIDVYNYGEMLRDFTYIDDIIEGIYEATNRYQKEPKLVWKKSIHHILQHHTKYIILGIITLLN